jgi:hypothetical protein
MAELANSGIVPIIMSPVLCRPAPAGGSSLAQELAGSPTVEADNETPGIDHPLVE